jgi:hypothetical protein
MALYRKFHHSVLVHTYASGPEAHTWSIRLLLTAVLLRCIDLLFPLLPTLPLPGLGRKKESVSGRVHTYYCALLAQQLLITHWLIELIIAHWLNRTFRCRDRR